VEQFGNGHGDGYGPYPETRRGEFISNWPMLNDILNIKPRPKDQGPIWEFPRRKMKTGMSGGRSVDHGLIERVKLVQPHFYDDVEITERNGDPYYRDYRYPEQLVPIGFLEDHRKFCQNNYNKYPCYRYLSKF